MFFLIAVTFYRIKFKFDSIIIIPSLYIESINFLGPGRSGASQPLSPLGTVRKSFPSYGSSISEGQPCGMPRLYTSNLGSHGPVLSRRHRREQARFFIMPAAPKILGILTDFRLWVRHKTQKQFILDLQGQPQLYRRPTVHEISISVVHSYRSGLQRAAQHQVRSV